MRFTRFLALAALVLVVLAAVGDAASRHRHHAAPPKEPISPPAPNTAGAVDNAPVEDGEDNGTDQDNDENPTPPLSKPAIPTPVTAVPAPAAAAAGAANGDIPAAGLAGPDANASGVQDESEANANAVRNENGLFCSGIGPRHLTLQCKEHPDGNCCGTAGFCCPKDHFCSLDAHGHATSKCVKRRKQIVISPTIIIHTGANGLNINGIGASASTTGLPDGVDTSDDVDDNDANEDSGLEDQDYNANSQLDVVPHRTGALSHPRRDKIVLVMKNRNKITRGKKHQADKDDEGNDDDDDDDSDEGAKSKKEGNTDTDADATAADPTGAAKNVPADK